MLTPEQLFSTTGCWEAFFDGTLLVVRNVNYSLHIEDV